MQSLGPEALHSRNGEKTAIDAPLVQRRRVLPRFMRKPVRVISHIGDGSYHVPRSLLVGFALLVAVISGFFGWMSNSPAPIQLAKVTAGAGFVVKHINMSGATHVRLSDIKRQLGGRLNLPMLDFDVREARASITNIPWVKDSKVSVIYPNTLSIDIVEHLPVAIWQSNGKLKLIAEDGTVLMDLTRASASPEYIQLPYVIGRGANINAQKFLKVMSDFPSLSALSTAYVRVADRRWDLTMQGGVRVMLPENGAAGALEELYRLQGEQNILARDLEVVDMRLPDRFTIRLSPESAEERKQVIDQQLDRLKKAMHKARYGGAKI